MKLDLEGYMTSRWWMKGNRTFSLCGDTATANRDGGEVKFSVHVMDDGGLRVAPHGRLTVTISGDRDPDWRRSAERKYGVLCRPTSELLGQLFCPHTKKAIPASRFEENYVTWVDKEFGVAVRSGNVSYEVPDGPPIPFAGHKNYKRPVFEYSFANHARYKVERERVEQLIAEAKMRVALAGDDGKQPIRGAELMRCLLKHREVTDMSGFVKTYSGIDESHENWLDNVLIRSRAWAVTRLEEPSKGWSGPTFDSLIKEASADRYESDYLEWREKG